MSSTRRHPHNILGGVYDLTQLRPTDMRNNKSIVLPNPRPDAEELILAARRSVWLRTAERYLGQNCDN